MAITSVDLTWSGEGSSWSTKEGGQSTDAQHVDVYNVVVNNTPAHDTTQTVLASGSVPLPKSAHPNNFYLRCTKVSAKRVSPIMVEVTAEYATRSSTAADGDGNPVNEPARIEYKTIKTEGEIDEDINGAALDTVNGEPVRGIRRKFADLGIEISKNFTTFDPVLFYAYIDTVNSDTFLGFAPGTCYLDDLTAKPIDAGDFAYVEVSALVIVRYPLRTTAARTWWARLLHEGFLVKSGTDIVHAVDDAGDFVSSPVRIKSDGTQAASGDASDWLEFPILDSSNFDSMGFGV